MDLLLKKNQHIILGLLLEILLLVRNTVTRTTFVLEVILENFEE
jgi:hypothetical protein